MAVAAGERFRLAAEDTALQGQEFAVVLGLSAFVNLILLIWFIIRINQINANTERIRLSLNVIYEESFKTRENIEKIEKLVRMAMQDYRKNAAKREPG